MSGGAAAGVAGTVIGHYSNVVLINKLLLIVMYDTFLSG